MNHNPSAPRDSFRRGYTFGVVAGFGSGLAIASVLYKHYSVANLTDPLFLLGFALTAGGSFLARRGRGSA